MYPLFQKSCCQMTAYPLRIETLNYQQRLRPAHERSPISDWPWHRSRLQRSLRSAGRFAHLGGEHREMPRTSSNEA